MHEQTGILPKALANRPILMEGCGEYLKAFNHLDSARGMHMEGLQSIMVSEVLAYCTLSGTSIGESALKLLRIVQALDNARINHWQKKNASNK